MKYLKIAICTVIIIIIILVVAIIELLNNESDGEEKNSNFSVMETLPIENANIERVKNRDTYYTIKYILDAYFKYVNYIEATPEELEITNLSSQDELIKKYTNIGIDGLKNIIDEEYFKKEKTDEQLKINSLNYKNKSFRIDSIYCQDKTLRETIYFAYLTLDYEKEMKIIIKIDSMTDRFSILPEDYINDNKYTEKRLKDIEIKDIKENEYNKYEYITITDEIMAQCYLEDYGNIALNDIKKSYESLELEYKESKFPTIEEYTNYIKNSKKDYGMLRVKNYTINSEDDRKIYTCNDQYGNTYIFKETAIMEYTVQLDDYTLENEEFNKKYKQVTNRDKGLLNIDKFFKMINMQDYTSAYKVLDENFKQNYFKTQLDFENYMKTKTFRYNKVNYKEYSNKLTDIYTYKVILTDIEEENTNEIEFNIVMKILEGTDFVMSFEVN